MPRPLAVTCAFTFLSASLAARAAPETAAQSQSLVESTGINTHFLDTGTVYTTEFDQIYPLLLQSGLQIVREASLGKVTQTDGGFTFVPEPLLAAVVDAGIRVNFLCDLNAGTPANCRDAVKGLDAIYPNAVASIEGPNEPDGFWSQLYPAGYQGQGFPAGAAAWQHQMYQVLKADPATASIPVYGIALGLAGEPPCLDSNFNPLGDAGQLADAVDFGNFHPYPGGNPWHPDIVYDFVDDGNYHQALLPSAALDPTPTAGLTGFDDDICQDRKPYFPKPMVATESGVQTSDAGIPEDHQAALVSRIVLENYRLGIVQTLLYELIDSGGQTFGLLRADASIRPLYRTLQVLLQRLSDPGPSFAPGTLDYALVVSPVTVEAGNPAAIFNRLEYIHHLLFQKRTGVFELVLWHEISTDHTYPAYFALTPPPMPAVLMVNQPIASATLTTVDGSGAAISTSLSLDGGIPFTITERFEIVELRPVAGASDAGTDAGPDAGESDAGLDAGTVTDAGPPIDGGTTGEDAGKLADDAGLALGERESGSCGCFSGGGLPGDAALLWVGVVLLRRRARRSATPIRER